MTPFMTTRELAVTPLSPLHIGCGQDFEPTNYIIEDGVLYGFDPSQAVLTDVQRERLASAAQRGSLLSLQRFFRDNAQVFKPHAQVLIPVSVGVARTYEQRVGRAANTEADGNMVFNRLQIERHVYTGTEQLPFIPGSSFKGALRTAWLDALNDGRPPHDVEFKRNGEAKSSAAMERRLLEGDFETSPLRLLKVADLMPVRSPQRQVMFAVNHKKREVIKDGKPIQGGGIAARRDCVLHGQYRLFSGQLTLPRLQDAVVRNSRNSKQLTPAAGQLNKDGGVDLASLAQRSYRYHVRLLQRELKILQERGLVAPDWASTMRHLLSPGGGFAESIQAGQVFLIRLGRHGGAESKVLSGDGVASIKIMGARGQRPTYQAQTKTVWLAAEHEGAQKHLLPFGWALVEIDPKEDNPALQQWCEQLAADRPDLATRRQQLRALRQRAQRQRRESRATLPVAAAQAPADDLVQPAQAAEPDLSTLSPQQRQIEALRLACRAHVARMQENPRIKKKTMTDPLYQQARELINEALRADGWSPQDRARLADVLERALPPVIAGWDARDQRKHLRLKQLREQA